MVNWYIKRLGQAATTIVTVVTFTFFLVREMPGGPMDYLRAQLMQQGIPLDRVNTLIELYVNMQPDKPVWQQYVNYVTALAHGDFGTSTWFREPVMELLGPVLPWTIFLMGTSLFLSFAMGVSLGAFMAYRESSNFDYTMTVSGFILTSIPFYVLALFLLFALAYQHQWFPTGGRYNTETTAGFNYPFIAGVLRHAALPLASTLLTGWAGWSLSMRANSIRVLGEDYLRVARLRGLPERRIALRYVGRNAILPMYTSLMIGIGFMLGGAVILESIFTYQGVGYYMITATSARDYPLLMGGFLLITLSVVVATLVADLSYGKLDPRAQRRGESDA